MFRHLYAHNDCIVRPARLKVAELRLNSEQLLTLCILTIQLWLVQLNFQLDALRVCSENRPGKVVDLIVVVHVGWVVLAGLDGDSDTLL